MPIGTRFTENVEIGAIRIHGQDSLEVVTTDGGKEVRNLRAEDEPRRYQVSLPVVDIEGDDTADYDSVRQMWADSGRGLEPFYFYDFVDDEDVLVRFESELQITADAGHLRQINTFTLKECLGE
jgi:hypothetical protein